MYRRLIKSKYGKTILAFVFFIPLTGFSQAGRDNQYRDSVTSRYCRICRSRSAAPGSGQLLFYRGNSRAAFSDIGFHRAHTLIRAGKEDSAYSYVVSSIRIYQTQHDDSLLYFARMLHALLLHKKQLFSPALKEYKEALAIGRPLHLPLLAAVEADIGMLYYELGNLDAAYAWYCTAKKEPGFATSLLLQRNVYNNLAIYYLYKKQYRQAEVYHLKSLAIRSALSDTSGMAESYLNLGDLYYDEYRDALAESYWLKSLRLATRLRHLPLLQMASYNLAEVSQAARRYKEALRYYKNSVRWKDSIWNRDKVWTLGEQQKQLAVQEKQTRIYSLEKNIATQQLETMIKRRERNTFIASSVMLLLVACMYLLLYRHKVKAARLLAAQHRQLDALNQTKDRLFSVIAHDMRAPLASLSGKSDQLWSASHGVRNPDLDALVNDTRLGVAAVQLLLDNLLYWSFSETGNLLLQTRPLPATEMIRQAAAHLDLQRCAKQIDICYHVRQEIFISGDSYTLKMIFRNLIQNAIKFSYAGQCIHISLFRETTTCRIEIRDQGDGIPEELLPLLFTFGREKNRPGTEGESGSGLGLWLCQDFVQQNKGSLRLENHPEGGANAILQLPLTTPYRS